VGKVTVQAKARLRAEADARGGVRLAELTQAAPLGLRPVGDAVYLVGSAAGPLGGDRVSLDVTVGPGARLVVRSAAASVTYGGWDAGLQVEAEVGEGGELDWHLEPLVATAGCHHVYQACVRLAPGARLRWTEELLLGRYRERPGHIDVRLDVDAGDRPLLRHQLVVGPDRPAWDGPAVTAGFRAVGLHLDAGPATVLTGAAGEGWARMPLDGPGVLTTVLAHDLPELRRRTAAALAAPR
jgi:urease accessory protein